MNNTFNWSEFHRAEKLSKNCLNLAEFLEYTYLAVFG